MLSTNKDNFVALEIEASLLPVEGGHSRFPQGSMLPPWILFTAPYVAIPDIMSVCVCVTVTAQQE